MDPIYTVIIAILAVLAVSGLFVGVTNDAVNFLNSAIGSKAAPRRVILIVASIGILVGTLTSSGMMEVARNGMFDPGMFSFHEVILLYLSVMFANIILLDLYNSWGLPTSTTVSLIFCLLGAAIAVSTFKIAGSDALSMGDLGEFIHTGRAFGIVAAILLSVVIALTVGTAVMYVSRLIFSFRYTRALSRYGALWCGASLTAIIYFALFKGLKGTLSQTAFIHMVENHIILSLLVCWLVCSLILFFVQRFKINILRITILGGTFALALAFAGNDLVNFIGVPIAGWDAFRIARHAGDSAMTMDALNENVPANFAFLVGAGVVMILTLWTSRKAMHVTETELSLASQNDEQEQREYGSSAFARAIVRATLNTNHAIERVVPQRLREAISRRFEVTDIEHTGAPFDMIRATVNLTTSALLIAMATSLKLPLSTTYVTFMVAMGTSLADRAWGRESAVFRITGVLSVIGGWFITAGVAFTVCFFVALAMYYGGAVVMAAMIVLAVALLIHSNIRYRRKLKSEHEDNLFRQILAEKDKNRVWELLRTHVSGTFAGMLAYTADNYAGVTDGFIEEERRTLRRVAQTIDRKKELLRKVRRRELIGLRRTNRNTAIEKNMWFHLGSNCCVQLHYALKRMCDLCREHVDNNFNPLPASCAAEFIPVRDRVKRLLLRAEAMIRTNDYSHVEELMSESAAVNEQLTELQQLQLNRIQEEQGSINVSLVYLNVLQESQEIISALRHMLRASRNFQQ